MFTAAGMTPGNTKIQAVWDWPTPANATALRQFLGLASYYRQYISRFSTIATPLNALTQKGAEYAWTATTGDAFETLKAALTRAPVLAYPNLHCDAAPFVVQTDVSADGLGAVLEQDNCVIAYASRALTKAERNYSVIQRECLAITYALKQFHHYLLGHKFHIVTDHAPLQWLLAQKMEGMLCRWILAMQEFNFDIKYCKGSLNLNADALSRRSGSDPSDAAAVTIATSSTEQLRHHQQQDPITCSSIENLKGVSKG